MEKIQMARLFKQLTIFAVVSLSLNLSTNAQQGVWTEQKGLGNDPQGKAFAAGFILNYEAFMIGGSDSRGLSNECWQLTTSLDIWTQKADFPGSKREKAVAFSIGNKGYVGTGLGENGHLKDFWEYDGQTNSWTRRADFAGGERSSATAFVIGTKAYVGTGYNGQNLGDFWEYNPAGDSWTSIAALPPRRAAVSFSLDNKGFVATGLNIDPLKDLWQYDVQQNTWTKKADFGGSARYGAIAFTAGYANAGYIATGETTVGVPGTASKELWQYDLSSDTWTQKPDLPADGRSGALVFNYEGNPKLVFGTNSGNILNDLWNYTAYQDKWYPGFRLTGARSAAVGLSVGHTGYIIMGGFWFEPKKEVWAYNTEDNSWSQKADFVGEPRGYSAGFTIGSKAYIATGSGGVYGQIYLNDFWEFDTEGNQWTRKADYPGDCRTGGVGFSLANKGYIGLGASDPMAPFHLPNELWQYDPNTDQWNKKADLPFEGRYGAGAFTIKDKAYVVSGRAANGPKTDFWEYDGVNDKWTQKADYAGEGRFLGASFSIGLNGYFGTGYRDFGSSFETIARKDFWQYNQLSEKWTQVADFGAGGRINASSFVVGNHAYVGLGRSYDKGTGPMEFRRDLWKFTPSNQPPIAAGFAMMYYYPNAHLLNAWGSYDPEGGPVKFLWKKVGGPAQYKMLYENASTPVISDLVTGTYTFQLTVTDQEGATANTEVSFSVTVNQPPVANGFVMMYYYPNAHLLNAWGSYDPEGGPVKFWWTKIAGPSQYNMLYPEASTPVISNLVVGTYSFQLRVTDNDGATAYDTVDIVNTVALSATNNNGALTEADRLPVISNRLSLSPNPATDILKIKWNSDYTGPAKLAVMDMSGKTVINSIIQKQNAAFSSTLHLNALKPGAYYLFIYLENGKSISSKFIRQ